VYITIDATDKRAIYQQLVDEIKALIAQGELPEGSSLPPVRQVAADLGVNLNTVAFAYRCLQREGLISVKHGSGAVVISKLLTQRAEEQLRAQLRAALTQLVLAGFTRSEITTLVANELNMLIRDRNR
jgi:DNA-binding transcriptional regulator YhcF (GntR family)